MHPTHTASDRPVDTGTRRVDGKPETDADRRFFDLRESGYTGPIDQDGTAVPAQTIPAPDLVTPARTLRDAALYLDRHDWCQGSYYDQTATCFTPAACMVGAIGMVCYGGPVDAPALNFDDPGWGNFECALAFLDEWLLARYGVVSYDFNDARSRTEADVILALDEAAGEWDRTNGGAE